MATCDKCEEQFKTESELKTHILLHHPEMAQELSDEYETEVREQGEVEPRDKSGEQFGYR